VHVFGEVLKDVPVAVCNLSPGPTDLVGVVSNCVRVGVRKLKPNLKPTNLRNENRTNLFS